MAHYTSRAEGLKIKEYKDYYDWNDDIRIRYNPNASHNNWTFTVLFSEGIWMDGVLYPEGSVIASFKDGTEVYYVMLAQHKEYDPETGEVISVTNFTYRVSSSLSTETEQVSFAQESSQESQQTGDEELDDIRYTVKSIPNGSHKDIQVKKYKNGTLTGTSIVTPDKITSYKVAHSQAYYKDYPVFNHLGFLWHGMNPESGYPQYSYTLVSRCDHLEVNGSTYGPHDPIRTWTWDQDIDLEVIDVSIPAEPYVPIDDKYPVIQIQFDTKSGSQDTIVVSKISDGVVVATKDVSADNIRESKLKGSKYRIFENLLLDWHGMDPESGYPQYSFTLISDSNYIKYDGNYVWQNTEIKTWQRNEIVSFQVVDETNRHSNVMKKNDVFNVHLSINGGAEQTLKKGDGIYSAVFHDHIKMYYNGKYHYAAWLAYDQPNVPGHYKTLGNLAIGYCRPYWVLITTAEGIYFNGHTYQARKLLKTWSDDDVVHLTLTQKKARKKTELNDKDSELIKYTVVTDENDPKITLTKYVNDLETAKSTFNPTLVENRTFNGIKFEISGGVISMYSKSDYIKFQNEGYKAKTFITSWDVTEKVNYEVYDKDFDKIQYIMDTALDSNLITISKQINDLDDDVVTFNPDTTAALDFHNIRFQVSNGKIKVYSKSDFVKLSGSTYKKGNLITSWPIEEKVYFAIVDESIRYEVITAITYNVDTEQVTEVDYDIETMSDEKWKPLKVQKKIPVKDPITGVILGYNYAEEKIIDYYDCVRPPYVIYDDRIQFEFNLGYYCWYLKSASDDVYINNEQYPAGTLIRSWNWSDAVHYDDIGHITDSHKEIHLKSTTVDTKKSYETTHEYITDPTYHVETKTEDRTLILTCDQPGSSTVTHNLTWHEITTVEWYTFYGLQFRYRTEEGWKVRANSNLIVKSNKRYSKGQVIFEWGYADNVDFGIDTLLEDIKHTQRTDEEKALMVSKDDEWLYGYIWKRYAPPGPTPTKEYDWDIFAFGLRSDYNGYKIIVAVDSSFGRRYAKRLYMTGTYGILSYDRGAYSVDTGDVGYLSLKPNNGSTNNDDRTEVAVYGNGTNINTYVRSASSLLRGSVFKVIQGSNNFVSFSVTTYVVTETAIINVNKKVYNKYTNELISEINTEYDTGLIPSISPGISLSVVGVNCFKNNKLYLSQCPNWESNVGIPYDIVIDVETATVESINQIPYLYSNFNAIRDECWDDLTTEEKNAIGSKYSLNIGVTQGPHIDDEMIWIIGTGFVIFTQSGAIYCTWYKYYKYNIITRSLTLISKMHDVPFPSYYGGLSNVRNDQLYSYVRQDNISGTYYDIYECTSHSIDGLISAEKINTIDNIARVVQIWRLDNNTYQDFYIGDLVNALGINFYQIQALPYSTRSSRFKHQVSGIYCYIDTNKSGGTYTDKWIICITDPSLQDFSTSFCFLASSLYWNYELDESWYRPDPQLQQ